MLHEQEPANQAHAEKPPIHHSTPEQPVDDNLSPDTSRAPVHPDTLLQAGIGLGIVMIALAVVWVNVFRQENIWADFALAESWWLLPGLVAGSIFAGLVWRIGRHMKSTRQIVAMLEEALDLGSIRFQHVILFSLLAAFPEEMLFRGAVQTQFGLLAASLIFGALHALTRTYFIYATIAGLLLGVLYALSGSLWMPVGAHFAIDVIMFLLLLHRKNHRIR